MTPPILPNEKSLRQLSEFESIQNPRTRDTKLGNGSFASVKLVREKRTGNLLALKKIEVNLSNISKSDLHNLQTEITIHRELNHQNIIKFHDYIQEDISAYLLLEYAPNGNLYNYMHKEKHLPLAVIFKFFYQTCSAVNYLHKNNILHRDLKPENLLLDKNLNIKLCDFGWSARNIKDRRTTFCGTYEYMAPEIIEKKTYDYRVDVWSLGVLLYELFHREAPYKGRSLPEITVSFAKGSIKYDPLMNPDARDLIEKILKANPDDRLSIDEILAHPWVKYNLYQSTNQQNLRESSDNIKSLQSSRTNLDQTSAQISSLKKIQSKIEKENNTADLMATRERVETQIANEKRSRAFSNPRCYTNNFHFGEWKDTQISMETRNLKHTEESTSRKDIPPTILSSRALGDSREFFKSFVPSSLTSKHSDYSDKLGFDSRKLSQQNNNTHKLYEKSLLSLNQKTGYLGSQHINPSKSPDLPNTSSSSHLQTYNSLKTAETTKNSQNYSSIIVKNPKNDENVLSPPPLAHRNYNHNYSLVSPRLHTSNSTHTRRNLSREGNYDSSRYCLKTENVPTKEDSAILKHKSSFTGKLRTEGIKLDSQRFYPIQTPTNHAIQAPSLENIYPSTQTNKNQVLLGTSYLLQKQLSLQSKNYSQSSKLPDSSDYLTQKKDETTTQRNQSVNKSPLILNERKVQTNDVKVVNLKPVRGFSG